jgi:hypothetical protein
MMTTDEILAAVVAAGSALALLAFLLTWIASQDTVRPME